MRFWPYENERNERNENMEKQVRMMDKDKVRDLPRSFRLRSTIGQMNRVEKVSTTLDLKNPVVERSRNERG